MEWIILGAVVIVLLAVVAIYNRLVALRANCRQGWADIDAGLRQRHDLIPNLVNTVQGYAAHEKSALESVIAARNNALAARGPGETQGAEMALGGALKNLFALAEAYPDLKANTNFQTLQHELADVEDKLAAARRAYNAASADYNTGIESFPAVLFAGALGFKPQAFWELGGDERATVGSVPKVAF
ncbi:LemA family protein [Blastomonas sp.]|uniref:LemA family protein n=1 Tax=Blastomonas sp. TaxID=1909299 RepID=UPI003593B074